ncbi:MAG: F0F1 ATP synthase subunit epsilon [Candidatus Acidulodesulfobacterium sp.]
MLKLKIADKKKLIFEGETDFCELPAQSGIEGVMPKHVNFISYLAAGSIKYKIGETIKEIEVLSGGLAEVSNDNVNILLDS